MAPPGPNADKTNTHLDDNVHVVRGSTRLTGAQKQRYLAWRGFPDAAGPLTLTRTDAQPLIDELEFRYTSWIDEGDRIGPFLPGPVEFELRFGRRFSKTVRVDVRAGEDVEVSVR